MLKMSFLGPYDVAEMLIASVVVVAAILVAI
jgi:hypothetical protein